MIENYMILGGLGCGTKKHFAQVIITDLKKGVSPRWYFRTPIKYSGHGLRTAVIDMAFPFISKNTDIDEKTILTRLEVDRKCYEDDLIAFLRKGGFIVPPDSAVFAIVPNYSCKTDARDERADFAGTRIHILNAVITVKYRESWFI